MSSSDPDSKIDLLDGPDAIKRKLKKAFAQPKVVEGNGLLSFVEYVLLPAGAIDGGKPTFTVERREGEPLVYTDAEKMKQDYAADILTPQLLKSGVTDGISKLLAPIQAAFAASEEWRKIEQLAYPPVVEEKKKKEKKVKNKGTFYPKKNVEAQPDGSVEGKDAQQVSVGKSAEEALKQLDLAKEEVKS